jgi:plastocyanin
MRVAVTRRVPMILSAVALVAVACGGPPAASKIDLGSGRRFVPAVVDSIDNVGVMPSLDLSGDGSPFASYFGFPAVLKPGEIPVTRSVYAPFVPSVLLASEHDGIFTRGAVAMAKPPPNLVDIPYGPASEASIQGVTAAGVNGTSLAVDAQGGLHVAWVDNTGLWYGSGGGSSSFSVTQVVKLAPKVKEAGPLGWPSVAIDDHGNAWIAYGDDGGGGQAIDVAVQNGDQWRTDRVASFGPCSGCPDPRRVAIQMTSDGPMVAYSDVGSDTPMAATLQGSSWRSQEIEHGGGGIALSMALTKDGNPVAAYYTGSGSVHVATLGGGGWSTKVAGEGGTADDPRLQTTGVAVDDQGTVYVAFYDANEDEVVLASSQGGSFAPIDTPGTRGGAAPDVAVTPDASQGWLAWYDRVDQNLNLGVLGESSDLALANPSPTTTGSVAPSPSSSGGGAACKSTGSSASIAAPVGAAGTGFDTQCLAVDGGKSATVTFENQDAGVAHNWDLFQDSGYTKSIAATQLVPGPSKETAKLPSLKPGTYYFHCDAHPTTMTGQLFVT